MAEEDEQQLFVTASGHSEGYAEWDSGEIWHPEGSLFASTLEQMCEDTAAQ